MSEPTQRPPAAVVAASEQPSDRLAERPDDPPVVARLVVEIRSDGSRTVARGAMEDRLLGETVGIELEGASPAALAASLARALAQVPFAALRLPRILRTAAKALLPGAAPGTRSSNRRNG